MWFLVVLCTAKQRKAAVQAPAHGLAPHPHTQQLLLHLVQLILFGCRRVKGGGITSLDAVHLHRGLETEGGQLGQDQSHFSFKDGISHCRATELLHQGAVLNENSQTRDLPARTGPSTSAEAEKPRCPFQTCLPAIAGDELWLA